MEVAKVILLDSILHTAILPAYKLLPPVMSSPAATVMLLAIGLQESCFMYRFQKVAGQPLRRGPARGFWQFERNGGVRGVMTHVGTKGYAAALCTARGVAPTSEAVHEALERDDILAAGFARVLLWSDPSPLPAVHADPEEGWLYYMRTWRPGKPHRSTWNAFHAQAVHQIVGDHEGEDA